MGGRHIQVKIRQMEEEEKRGKWREVNVFFFEQEVSFCHFLIFYYFFIFII